MATVAVCNSKNEQIGEIELNDEIFNVQVKSHLLHEVVVMQLAKRRSGSARGGGRKPWRQKGTGRSRAGTRSSPIWRGGGVTFGPKPRDYTPKVNKKIRKQALKMALSSKWKENQVVVVDGLDLDEIKTKAFSEVLQAFDMDSVLVVINVPHTKVLRSEGLNVYDILRYQHLVLIKEAVPKIEAALLGKESQSA
jgi:large subunit ribosomal protein L4